MVKYFSVWDFLIVKVIVFKISRRWKGLVVRIMIGNGKKDLSVDIIYSILWMMENIVVLMRWGRWSVDKEYRDTKELMRC